MHEPRPIGKLSYEETVASYYKTITLYKDIEGLDLRFPLSFCDEHLEIFGKYTALLNGSSEVEGEEPRSPSIECAPCRFSESDIGYLGHLVEAGVRLARRQDEAKTSQENPST